MRGEDAVPKKRKYRHGDEIHHQHTVDLERVESEYEDTIKMSQRASASEFLESLHSYVCSPPPPLGLWDTDDLAFLDRVKAHAWVRLTAVDPKNGRFEARMKVHWSLRSLNLRERTEPRIRVPGIRVPSILSTTEESRVWRELGKESEKSILWAGTSTFSLAGWEMFEVHDFPYDRQIINWDMFDFVWRHDKETDTFEESMKMVEFDMECSSMLPEWDCFPALLIPRSQKRPGAGPSHCSRFQVKLRLQRKHKYYITQVFMVTYMILTASLFPLAMDPSENHIGDRLALHAGGLLTLVAFRYGIAEQLPSVPYLTFTDWFLLWQVVTLVMVSVESVVTYKLAGVPGVSMPLVNMMEDVLLIALVVGWLAYFLYCALWKKRMSWADVLANQDQSQELHDDLNEQ